MQNISDYIYNLAEQPDGYWPLYDLYIEIGSADISINDLLWSDTHVNASCCGDAIYGSYSRYDYCSKMDGFLYRSKIGIFWNTGP